MNIVKIDSLTRLFNFEIYNVCQVDRLIAENYLLRRQLNLVREHSSLRVANLVATVLSWLDGGATGINGQTSHHIHCGHGYYNSNYFFLKKQVCLFSLI